MPRRSIIRPFEKPPQGRRRRSIRLPGYDYAQPGSYYVTIDTHNQMCLFGKISIGEMRLNNFGIIAYEELVKTPTIRREIKLDEFIVMPNHMHAIIIIMESGNDSTGAHGVEIVGADGCPPKTHTDNDLSLSRATGQISSTSKGTEIVGADGCPPNTYTDDDRSLSRATCRSPLRPEMPRGPTKKSLSALIGGYKSIVTTRINQIRNTPGAPIWQRNYYEHIIHDEDDLSRIREYIRNNPAQWETEIENG
jgi:putative transposase